jgi:hypothetical protein
MCAKIKFGMFMTDARGKVGGQVFSKNRGGAYVRTKVTPANGQTARQSFVRQLLGAVSQSWSGLTQSARDSFDGAVAQWSKTDIFGDVRNPTGKSLFIRLNINLANSGQAEILLAPSKLDMPFLTATAVNFNGTAMTIADIDNETSAVLVVSATAPQSAGTNFFRGKYRQIGFYPGASVVTADLFDDYVSKFGTPDTDANVSFELKWVLANGQTSTPLFVKMLDA